MILLDTVTFLWIITGSNKLSPKAKSLYLSKENKVFLSCVSLWEIIVKYKLGRLPLPEKPFLYVPAQRRLHGIESLDLSEEDVQELESLPKIHNDPFDRMIVCQAKARNFTVLTPDKLIRAYPIKTSW